MKTFLDTFGVTGPLAIWGAEENMDVSRGLIQALDHLLAGGPLDATETIPCGSTRQGMLGGLYTVCHVNRP